jgi:CheY-like chemotaxis protein
VDRKRILLIDDDPLVLRTVEAVLKREAYDCVACLKAEAAVEKARTEDFDLIVSDIRMPGKNGVEAMQEIRQLFRDGAKKKDIPMIFITGYAEDSVTLNAEGIGEVILKPFDLKRFLMTIREYL